MHHAGRAAFAAVKKKFVGWMKTGKIGAIGNALFISS